MVEDKERTVEEIKNEIVETVNKVVGNINNLDSKKEKADVTLAVLNDITAGVELSKIEKAGTLVYLISKRLS